MDINLQKSFKGFQNLYFLISLIILAVAVFSFLYGIVESKALQGVPVLFLEFLRIVLYYHIIHFILGIILLISIIRRRKLIQLKFIKTIIGIIISPISLLILMSGLLLLGLSSCAT